MLKDVLLIMSLSLLMLACESLPKVPQHTQFGVHADLNPPGFYGVHNETKDKIYRSFDDPSMKASQCLTADDYKSFQNWYSDVKKIIENRCNNAKMRQQNVRVN